MHKKYDGELQLLDKLWFMLAQNETGVFAREVQKSAKTADKYLADLPDIKPSDVGARDFVSV